MATLPKLVGTLAALDGRPISAVAFVGRLVREAGFIQTTKRGRGAADMTALDAAYLLLGLYGARDTTDAAEAAATLGKVQGIVSGAASLPHELAAVRRAPDLAHTLAALIELGGRLSWDVPAYLLLLDNGASPPVTLQDGFVASFIIRRPKLACTVQVGWRSPDPNAPLERLRIGFILPEHDWMPPMVPAETETRISTRMFIGLHRVLFPSATKA